MVERLFAKEHIIVATDPLPSHKDKKEMYEKRPKEQLLFTKRKDLIITQLKEEEKNVDRKLFHKITNEKNNVIGCCCSTHLSISTTYH